MTASESKKTQNKKQIPSQTDALKGGKKKKPDYFKPYLKKKYFYGTGRRKSAIARVRLYKGRGRVYVNDKELSRYFSLDYWQEKIMAPLVVTGQKNGFDVVAYVAGGGSLGQAEAMRLGVARALVRFQKDLRQPLGDAGLLKRDPREKERKKPGLKSARRSPQWAKR